MQGVTFTLELAGVDAVLERLQRLGRIEFYELTQGLAELGVSQTQTRIEEEKTGPDGAAWPRTTDDRAALFVTGAHLYNSIQADHDADTATWGTGWIGARVHQYGATIIPKDAQALRFVVAGREFLRPRVTIPARPYIGLSAANAAEMEKTAALFIERYVQ